MKAKFKAETLGTLLTQLAVAIASIFYIAPLYMIINYAFKTKRELYIGNPLALPESLSLENFVKAFEKLKIGVTMSNTVLYTLSSVILLALVCGPAAWAISRAKGAFFKFSYLYFIIGILIPAQALFLPIYVVGYRIGLVNTRIGIILMFVATNISFGVFLLTSFMSTVPIELEESARMDGCSVYGTYFRIVMPLLKPALATLIIMQSFQIWNDYLMSSLYVSKNDLKPLTVAIQSLFSAQSSDYSTAFAAIAVSALPIVALFVALQKYFVKGMTVGAVKG
ncbi:MAG: carbohydrate ABC transporter permease [Clostridiales bacterium]|nr:carbohydrate ABC transporter permease [Clostridiales bacterium]